jgi:hypothetical protein
MSLQTTQRISKRRRDSQYAASWNGQKEGILNTIPIYEDNQKLLVIALTTQILLRNMHEKNNYGS